MAKGIEVMGLIKDWRSFVKSFNIKFWQKLNRRRYKRFLGFLVGLSLVLAIASCNVIKPKLEFVEALPAPDLPEWIEQISPTAAAEPLAQIKIKFQHPLIPVEALGSDRQQQLLRKFEIFPSIPGQFRFLTPRMVGFQADRALPKASRFRVTLKSGLADLEQHELTNDIAWTFETESIGLSNLPGDVNEPVPVVDIEPELHFTANTELEAAVLSEYVQLLPARAAAEPLPIAIELDEQNTQTYATAEAAFNPNAKPWNYRVIPQAPLAKDTTYKLSFLAGLPSHDGNLPLAAPLSSTFKTYAPLKFEQVRYIGQPDRYSAYGRFLEGSPQLRFNNGVMAESAIANISIQPAADPDLPLLQVYDGSTAIELNPYALEPATTYQVTIAAGLEDAYGQSLSQPESIEIQTSDVAADLWAPEGLNIFPPHEGLQLNLEAVNLPDRSYRAAYKVVQPDELIVLDAAYDTYSASELLPSADRWRSFAIDEIVQNQPQEVAIPLRERLGSQFGMLAYGIKADTNTYWQDDEERRREVTHYGLVQLTNLGVFAQVFPTSALVRVNHLSDGAAVENSQVEIYQSKLYDAAEYQPGENPCATGKTNAKGLALLNQVTLKTCFEQIGNGEMFDDPPSLLVVVKEAEDWAFTQLDSYSGAYSYGIYSDWWQGQQPKARGEIFSDRQLYKPGEEAWFTATAYFLENGELKQDKQVPYAVTMRGPSGEEESIGTITTNEYGTFSFTIDLPAESPLGFYTVMAKAQNRDDSLNAPEIRGQFRVAEFKPPNFKVDLSLNREVAVMGQTLTAQAQSDYLFGAPVESGTVKYFVSRDRSSYAPDGWDDFQFGKQWWWPELPPTITSEVLEEAGSLSADGSSSQAIEIDADLPYAMTYTVSASVTDVANLEVSDTKTIEVLPSDRLIGLHSNYLGEADEVLPIEVIVSDPEGNLVRGRKLKLELQKREYSRYTQVIEGSATGKNNVEYKTIATAEVTSGNQPQTINLTPTEAGSYRIHANFADATSEATATDTRIWVTGGDRVYWGNRYDNNRLDVNLDKNKYKIGDRAKVLIQSPYEEAELSLSIVRDKAIYRMTQKVSGAAPQISFTITPDMLPNAAVEVVLIRQGQSLDELELGSMENLMRVGLEDFQVDLDDRYLQVAVSAEQTENVQPGDRQTLNLALKNNFGSPVKGQLTVMVVNDAVLQLTGYRPPDLVETVYADQPILTRFSDNRPDVVLANIDSALEKGWGYGGGLSTGITDPRPRTKFEPLAYYNGSVITDDQGQAQISFTLPDDLTTWRVMVVGTDGDLHFGRGETDFIATKPLLANPVLPQFARVGDRFEAGLAITNSTDRSGNIDITGEIIGGINFLQPTPNDEEQPTPDITLSKNVTKSRTSAVRMPMVATTAGKSQLQFAIDRQDFNDIFAVPLEVKPLRVTEQVIETGQTYDQITIPLEVDDRVDPDAGGLEVSLSSTLMPAIIAPAKAITRSEQPVFLQPVASQLIVAASLAELSTKYAQTLTNFDPAAQANQALSQLQKLQRPSGGFASYPGAKYTDPFMTPYAAIAVVANQQANLITPNPGMVDGLKKYLGSILANPSQDDLCYNQICKDRIRLNALDALDALGDRRSDFVAELYQRRQELDEVAQITLARHLIKLGEAWQSEAEAIIDQLEESIYETGRTATINLPKRWRWSSSTTVAQAEALKLMVEQGQKPEFTDRLLQGLLAQRRDGLWRNDYENAKALAALVAYARNEPTPPNFVAIANLDEQQIGTAQFVGYRDNQTQFEIPMAELPQGEQNLVLSKTGAGTLHYLTAYRYRLSGEQPGRFNGLRVTRHVYPLSNADLDQQDNSNNAIATLDLTTLENPVALKTAQVFDIGVDIITDHPVDHVMISDPLPAGLEAIDTSFQTANPYFQAAHDSWQINYQNIHRDRVVAYADHLEAGVYQLHYLVRSVTPGEFKWPGAEAHLQYAPEEFGRSASSSVTIVNHNN
ncbi:alpha-2-macroglobulin domain protein [Thalassoporum mexicanum PCC 7367]|uniref:alpha-2-macroglobulin family protein n=2 Tax=Thalassoporum mexicanum TaxID=3457544 RepID=UPI00029FA4D5|nr:alpha-2-macroglobulin domain protein [Pseudanabaena sp. PCC 7367]